MTEKSATIRNITDIIIKDLQGNYYDINMLYCNGNDELTFVIKKRDDDYISQEEAEELYDEVNKIC